MTTPRTIKASEVVKGMRVRVEENLGSRTTQVTEGPVMVDATPYSGEYVDLELEGTTFGIAGDHPVTVLADPEPEWVEGAWYRCRVNLTGDGVKLMRRGVAGWTSFEAGPWTYQDAAVTVLGRVLVVDWPGDGVARNILAEFPEDHMAWQSPTNATTQKVADTIRTQGGVR